jgi:lysine-N-methylase
MLYVRPDFYDGFRCLADACRHSCCVGWEIDVDADSLAYYKNIDGELGRELRESIALEPTPHFRLAEGERCPFLRGDGLCRLIIALGEDSLCDICALHPRFFNDYPGREEAGLGLCCEEAARLLTAGEGHLRLVTESDGEEEPEPTPLLCLRDEIFAFLSDDALSLAKRMRRGMQRLNRPLAAFHADEAARFFLTLERMDPAWTALLHTLAAAEEREPALSAPRHARIAEYLVYRHFASAESEADAAARLQFCFHAVRLVAALEAYSADALRLFSAEIEYSDENVEKICRWLS